MNVVRSLDRREVLAAIAVISGALAAIGTTFTWFTIEIGGVAAPGGSATGMEGRDGWTVLGGALAAFAAAGLLLLRRRPMATKVLLLAAGSVTTIVAVAGILDATGKDTEVEEAYGISADRVAASVGTGLWLVAVGGLGELAAGAACRSGAEEGGLRSSLSLSLRRGARGPQEPTAPGSAPGSSFSAPG